MSHVCMCVWSLHLCSRDCREYWIISATETASCGAVWRDEWCPEILLPSDVCCLFHLLFNLSRDRWKVEKETNRKGRYKARKGKIYIFFYFCSTFLTLKCIKEEDYNKENTTMTKAEEKTPTHSRDSVKNTHIHPADINHRHTNTYIN